MNVFSIQTRVGCQEDELFRIFLELKGEKNLFNRKKLSINKISFG